MALRLNRRNFFVGIAAAGHMLGQDRQLPLVNADRLRRDIEGLSAFGRPSGGNFSDGVSRVAYSDADRAGRAFFMDRMKAAGLAPRVDPAGNIFGRRTKFSAPNAEHEAPILFGSHIDSVPSGGNFDGDLGSFSALEVIRTLDERGIRTRRPLEMVVWANEEGVAFNSGLAGSRACAGRLASDEMDRVWNGMKKPDAIRRIGGVPERISEARRPADSFHAYLELHIEQGGTLERDRIPVGVVEGIVAIDEYIVDVRGFSNHAGTTPMPGRHDALIAASQLTLAVNEIVTHPAGPQVGTVGQMNVTPNAPNVVPGAVRMTVELRDLSQKKLDQLGAAIRARAAAIATQTGTEIDMKLVERLAPAIASPKVQSVIEESAAKLKLPSKRLPSGAGHDAQSMAFLGPMGMIFIPSIGGISHSPKELSRWEDCARGANVLLHSVLALSA
ncbi:MAG: Zn-dependent hydrolase [Bryobacteraceae bacterium]